MQELRHGLMKVTGIRLDKPDWRRTNEVQSLPISILTPDPELNPRKSMNPVSLQELAESLKKDGFLKPIKICRGPNDEVWVIGGHRRLKAAEIGQIDRVPCLISQNRPNQVEALMDRLLDNLHGEELLPSDRAESYRDLMKLKGLSKQELAESLSLSVSSVSSSLILLRLDKEVQEQIDLGAITEGDGVKLARLKLDKAGQLDAALNLVTGKWSSADLENKLKESKAASGNTTTAKTGKKKSFQVGKGKTVIVKGCRGKQQYIEALTKALALVRKEG